MSSTALRRVPDLATDIDVHLFETNRVAVGAFRCRPTHPLFGDSGPIRNHCVVFPRTSSEIQPAGFQTFVGTQSVVSVYNAGQVYRRRMVSPIGDHSDYFVVEETTLRQVAAAQNPRAADASEAFSVSHVPAQPSWYFRQRQIFRRVTCCSVDDGQTADPFEIEEQILLLLGDVLRAISRDSYKADPPDTRGSRRRRDLVQAAQQVLGCRACEPLTLSDLGAELGVSTYHLCRTFRDGAGTTLHRYREQVRLATALGLIEDGLDLTRVALDVGYSSHSHFTAAFRRAFGIPPSAAR